jgi:hypothetical protein
MSSDSFFAGRAKTQRKQYGSLDLSGAVALGFFEKTFQALNRDVETALQKPWHKLDRGLRIGRLRDFVQRETHRLSLSPEDSENLFKLLLRALDKKLLNSKAAVTYEPEKEAITEIKGLVAHTTAAGTTKFTFVEKKTSTTVRRRPSLNKAKEVEVSSSNGGEGTPKNEVGAVSP